MVQSVDRIRTTHVGSLPRPSDLLAMIVSRQEAAAAENGDFDARVLRAVADIVDKQIEVGLDIVNDGEVGRHGFISYINERLDGLRPGASESGSDYWGRSREGRAFPEYYEWTSRQQGSAAAVAIPKWVCCGSIRYKGHAAIDRDIDNLKAALRGHPMDGAFMYAISPANVERWQRNSFYS